MALVIFSTWIPDFNKRHGPTHALPFVSCPLAAVFDSKALLKLEIFSEE